MVERLRSFCNAALASACVIASALQFGSTAYAQSEFIVDQSQTTFNEFVNLGFSGVTGQEFIPTLPSLDVVELLFDLFGPATGALSVRIHQDSITGPVVGTSLPVTVTVTVNSGNLRQTIRFDFPISVSLIPGNTYVIEVNRLSDVFFSLGLTQGDTHSGGQAIIAGELRSDSDLFFREGQGATTTSLLSSPNPSFAVGTPVTFTAAVAPVSGGATPTGTITFNDGTTTIGSGVLDAGRVA